MAGRIFAPAIYAQVWMDFLTVLCKILRLRKESLAPSRDGANVFWRLITQPNAFCCGRSVSAVTESIGANEQLPENQTRMQ
jgi:hypothetical protein